MKKLLFIITMLCMTMALTAPPAEAQSKYTPSASGYVLGDTTRMVKVYDFTALSNIPTTVIFGVYYTKGASEDTLSRVELYHALDKTALLAGYGEKVSTDTNVRFGHTAASEYVEETITLSGGIQYLGIKVVPVGTATDTTNIKPYIFVK